MDYVRIDEQNKDIFLSVLPEDPVDELSVCIGAMDEKAVCGGVSVSFYGDMYSIDWLYVTPSMRRRGVARGLLREVQSLVAEIGFYPILMQVIDTGDNGIRDFLSSIESEFHLLEVTYSHDRYVITREVLVDHHVYGSLLDKGMITDYKAEMFWNMGDKAIAYAMSLIDVSLLDDSEFQASCKNDLCIAMMKKDRPEAFCLVLNRGRDGVLLYNLYSSNVRALVSLFQVLSDVMEEYDTKALYYETTKKKAALFAEKLFPAAKKETVYDVEMY